MIPYNTKLWTVPPAEMDHAWCTRFVPVPTPEDVVLGALAPAGAGHALGYNATFLYPRGGIGQLAARLRASVNAEVRTGIDAKAIDWQSRSVVLSDDSRLSYDALVSTMPLPDLVQRLVNAPEIVVEAARSLRATSVTYWDIGLCGANRPDAPHWIYYPEPTVPFYRAGSASAAVAELAPPGHRSHYVEVSHPRGTPCPVSDAAILAALRQVRLLAPDEEPLVFQRNTLDCAYVIMDAAYGRARAAILDWLRAQRIVSAGRYGAWTYDSMEGAMVQGRKAAHELRVLA